MKLRDLFFKNDDEQEDDDDYYETVDPVVEARRKEKFSTPFLNDDDDEEEQVKPKVQAETKKPKPAAQKKEPEPYRMSQIISPTEGLKKSKTDPVEPPKKNVKKTKKSNDDELVPVFSPFNGPDDLIVEESKPQKIRKAKPKKKAAEKPVEEETETVEGNLRNIANLIDEEDDELKIIEERTGKFKLDFSDNQDSFIDEIDDDMSLDELMSLYEKKFKD